MSAAAKKKTPPLVIVGGREQLAGAIERAAEAQRRVEAKREAVSRSVDAIDNAEARLDAARSGVAKAKEHDVRRAAAGISAKRPSPATSTVTQQALEEIAEAEASLQISTAARKNWSKPWPRRRTTRPSAVTTSRSRSKPSRSRPSNGLSRK